MKWTFFGSLELLDAKHNVSSMRPSVNSSFRPPPIGHDPSTPEGKNRLYRLAASECTAAVKTLIKERPHPNETPNYILVLHAIELGLKAFLIKSGIDEKTLKNRPYGHNLSSLYAKSVAAGLTINNDNACGLLTWVNEWHNGVKIRYEFAEERELPMCSVLVPLADAIIAASE